MINSCSSSPITRRRLGSDSVYFSSSESIDLSREREKIGNEKNGTMKINETENFTTDFWFTIVK